MYVNGENANKLIIKLASTGMIPTKEDTPYVPITPKEIADDTYKAYKLGVSVVHVHARDEFGEPTYKKEILKKYLRKSEENVQILLSVQQRVAEFTLKLNIDLKF